MAICVTIAMRTRRARRNIRFCSSVTRAYEMHVLHGIGATFAVKLVARRSMLVRTSCRLIIVAILTSQLLFKH